MGSYLDSVPMSGIVRIRDMMFTVKNPFRLDQGDVSFDAPDTVKQAMIKAVADNHTHYLPTTGLPRLRQLMAQKLRDKNHVPVENDDEVIVTNGGIHGLFAALHALLEPGDEVILPDPQWPPTMAIIQWAGGVPVQVPLHESLAFRWDLDELEKAITPKTRVLYLNSPNNPSGGSLTRADLERLAAIARERNLWVVSDEAYEDVLFNAEHISIASLPGMYERTIPCYTLSKSYAMTGVRVGYFAIKDATMRARATKLVLYTASNVSSIAQYGAHRRARGIAAVPGGLPHRAQGPARPVLRRHPRRGAAGLLGQAAGGRVLRLREDQPRLGPRDAARSHRVGVVGGGRAPDQARAHRLRPGPGLRPAERGLRPVLHRAQPRGADRGARVDAGGAGRHRLGVERRAERAPMPGHAGGPAAAGLVRRFGQAGGEARGGTTAA